MDDHVVIDATARRALALRLRRLASGRLATGAFDDARVDVHPDEALVAISDAGWNLYHDGLSYRLRGRHALKRETRLAVARCVLFLKSGLSYEWPRLRPNLGSLLLGLLTVGSTIRRTRRAWEAAGTHAVWPFFRVSDYEAALRRPPFLTGASGGRAA